MSVIYLSSDGGRLTRKGETLIFIDHEGHQTTIFPYKTEQIITIGQTDLTGPAIRLLMKYKIDTVFISKNGSFNGRLTFKTGKNVFLRMRQYKLYEDENFRLNFSKAIVGAKLHNQLNFIQRILRTKFIDNEDLRLTVNKMKKNIEDLKEAKTVDEVMGYEGVGAKYYFSILKYGILPEWAVFNGRTKNPPKDNVNAVLSFLYTLIYYRIEASLETEGLDIAVGYFHSLDYGRSSLVFDLIEELRVPLGDMTTLSLFNLNILKKDDFREVDFSEKNSSEYIDSSLNEDSEVADKGVYLNQEGLTKVIKHFEKKLEEKIYYPGLNEVVSYKRLINEQVKHLKRVINNEEREYKPFLMR